MSAGLQVAVAPNFHLPGAPAERVLVADPAEGERPAEPPGGLVLLFAFGVMNLLWIAGLMVYVLLEKVLPYPRVVPRIAGLAAIAGGIALILA